MIGKRVEPLEIENAEKMQFLFLCLRFLMFHINHLFSLVTAINFFGFVIGYYAQEEMHSFG